MAKTPDLERYRLVISIPDQRIVLLDGVEVVREYRISTALKGTSEALISDGTPRGLHVIAEKIGAGQPIGMIFKGREPIGEISPLDPEGIPPVVTRLFRLRGLEASNQTSYERLIYLHGSPHEKLLGQPASGGCIRMSSDDIIALFNTINVGTSITILEETLPKAIVTTLAREQLFAARQAKVRTDMKLGSVEAKAIHSLCAGHMFGLNGVPQNYPAAREWCELSESKGDASAMVSLAGLFERGKLGSPDLQRARSFYEHSAALDHPRALAKATAMQQSGIGGTQDLAAAQRNVDRLKRLPREKQSNARDNDANSEKNPSQ